MSAGTATFDLAIIGGGMVGASIAYFTAPARSVLLIEAESAPGYHATGRSAALFMEAYGPPAVRALTRASRSFFDAAPGGFAPAALLAPRGSLVVARSGQRAQLLGLRAALLAEGDDAVLLEAGGAQSLVPALRSDAAAQALYDAGACDIDVDALLNGFLRGARASGATVLTGLRVTALASAAYGWDIGTAGGGRFRAAMSSMPRGRGRIRSPRWPAFPASASSRGAARRSASRRRREWNLRLAGRVRHR